MIKNSILNILGCISFFSILWIVVFFGLGEFNHFVLRDVKEAKIVVEQNPKYSNIYCLECFQENLYCMSESKSKILVYDFQGNYVKTLQLPYSSTGYDYISINKNYISLFSYLFISYKMSSKPYFIGSTGIYTFCSRSHIGAYLLMFSLSNVVNFVVNTSMLSDALSLFWHSQ